MKKNITLLFLGLFLCFTVVSAQDRQTRNVGSFTKVAFQVPGKLHIKQGSTAKVEVQAPSNLQSKILTEVDGSKLVIHSPDKWNWSGGESITVYITITSLEALTVGGSGDVIGEGKFTTRDLHLGVSGSGSMEIEIEASGNLEANVSGSGELNVRGSSKSTHGQVSGSGRANLTLNMTGEADFSISGSGKIEASGKASELEASISGSGKVLASNLEVVSADIHISGSGGVETNVKEAIDARISGSGNVRYKGNPSKVNVDSSGSGGASKM
jgi:hypothetical protein